MESTRVVILSAVRTPIGSLNGRLSSLSAHSLGSIVMKEALNRASISPDDVTEVIFGQVLTAGQGQNPARQAAVSAGIPYTVPATIVNMLCGSGLKSVGLAYQSVQCDGGIILCGGQESMSNSPHTIHMRTAIKTGPGTLTDTLLHDGLTDAFYNYHMGITAENVAKQWSLTRQEQDEFALRSQQHTETAQQQGYFNNEIVGVDVNGKKNDVTNITMDEFPRPGSSLPTLAKLRPCFITDGSGTVTAGNSSGINDGAAALILCSEAEAKHKEFYPLCRIISWAQAGVDPSIMGTGPIPAVRLALKKAGWSIEDVDLWELNEAFAAQSLAVIRDLGINIEKVNVNGGAIALGHPIGASGARILVTLIHSMIRLDKKRGVATLCVGGGMGVAMCIQRDD